MSAVTSNVNAQEKVNLPVICPSIQKLTEVLKKYKEEPVYGGIDTLHGVDKLAMMLFYNKTSKTYTLVLSSSKDNVVCVVSSGEMGEFIFKE